MSIECVTQFVLKLGFLINPIAGIGGRVGLKGSDGPDTPKKALEMGARPMAGEKAMDFLSALKCTGDIEIYTCGGRMGQSALEEAGMAYHEVVYSPAEISSAADTSAAIDEFESRGIDLIAFCGGDGTARDVYGAIKRYSGLGRNRSGQHTSESGTPIIGIPAGVKMYSSVFALSPEAAAFTVCAFTRVPDMLAEAEIMDLDEEAVREGKPGVRVKLHGMTMIPFDPTSIQRAKTPSAPEEKEFAEAIASCLVEEMEKEESHDILYILGPGSVKKAMLHKLGLEGSFLGVDAIRDGRMVGLDLSEKAILELLDLLDEEGEIGIAQIIVTPIGAQGFVLGRGNHQISPDVLKRVGSDNIRIVATPHKLSHTPRLFVQTGDKELDMDLAGYRKILVGYRMWEMKKVEAV